MSIEPLWGGDAPKETAGLYFLAQNLLFIHIFVVSLQTEDYVRILVGGTVVLIVINSPNLTVIDTLRKVRYSDFSTKPNKHDNHGR